MEMTPSPVERSLSPDVWNPASLALNAIPPLDRSVSTNSTRSSASGRSASSSRISESGIPGRRGYMRPEGTQFSRSARSRDSVMNLGTIAHLQYYFARTGLLDEATGRIARKRKNGSRTASGSKRPLSEGDMSSLSTSSIEQLEGGLVESPIDGTLSPNWEETEPMMLPPTVSTYKNNPIYVPPPPDMTVLRRELRETLEETAKHLRELEKGHITGTTASGKGKSAEGSNSVPKESSRKSADTPGWHQIEGLNLLDVTTLAIRAAKNYYTAHEDPQRLYAIRPEREIRKELYDVLEVLKRLAIRNFANGVQPSETSHIKEWVEGIGDLLDIEEETEQREQLERESWAWLKGDWSGRERERELLFLRSFDGTPQPLSEWTDPAGAELPTPFLAELQSGLRLVHLHNVLVKKSRRQFETIKQYHTDTAKPYRCADNLRYWAKAADLRWDVKVDIDAMGVVHGEPEAWLKFDAALLEWSRGVREEMMKEWKKQKSQTRTPTLKIDTKYEAA
ncbi:hypothetical protein P280DRAFT_168717 [Massarina eburnea CBS 473.64]|uniref:Uncharacterized protein n=1 Tax=Massarina eburnea CBS 473.64 TaxID=1395130 RepID=A0A6A6RKH0_9PLEO|nr:hypothetical protein P280DRAFT_168717 [Massarina eburnea CBS 473.64]